VNREAQLLAAGFGLVTRPLNKMLDGQRFNHGILKTWRARARFHFVIQKMASANPKTALVACPHCGAQYDFPVALAGKRGKCAQCGGKFTVPSAEPKSQSLGEMPQYIGVECHLCGTRFYGGPDQIGNQLKCPDCGARTVLPPPPPTKGKNIPEAMGGDQYELWEPDAHPAPSEQLKYQPRYIAVTCTRCETLMYATEKQVGQSIECPDCGRSYIVPAPKKPTTPKRSVVSDIDVPMLDPAAAPTENPSLLTAEMKRQIEEEERNSEYGRALEKSRRTGKPMEVDVRGRPILPRWPLITGVLPFMVSTGVPVRWLFMSVGIFISAWLAIFGVTMAMSGGLAAVGGMCIFALGGVLAMIVSSISFGIFRTIVAESAEGMKEIGEWSKAFDLFGDFLAFVVAAMMSGFPAWLIVKVLPRDPLISTIVLAASIVISFPITVLSQLDVGSIWGVLSPRLLTTLVRCPFSWLMFFAETAAMAALFIAGVFGAAAIGINPLIVAAPLGAAIFILYARLLGRLAWRIAEAVPA
jgi:DNA-directed RNA polymerase subunit RPC12/RpoP